MTVGVYEIFATYKYATLYENLNPKEMSSVLRCILEKEPTMVK
jgi:hypothetical protein